MAKPALPVDKSIPTKGKWIEKDDVQKRIFILLAVGPSYLGYLLFTLYPNALSIYYSFLDWDGISEKTWIGFGNFVRLFQDEYVWRAMWHNVIFMATIPTFIVMISLVLAYVLNNKPYREGPFYKVLFFFPNVLSTVVIALLWVFIYDGSYGLLNAFLEVIGIDTGEFYWLGDTRTAIWAIIPQAVWAGVGLYIIIFMNAMKGIPGSLHEAAIIEGASHMTRLFRITIPLMSPVIRIAVLFTILGSLKGFENVLIMTNGGPSGSTDVTGLYMFNLAFGDETSSFGYASAIGMFLFIILVGAKLLIDKFVPNQDVEY